MRNYIVIVEGHPVYIRIDFTKMSIEITVKGNGRDLTAKAKLKEVKEHAAV
jgi:hypothetical protein